MKTSNFVHTSNVVKALDAMNALVNRAAGEEGMALLYGRPGEGKTTCTARLVNQYQGVFLRANVAWSVTSMLQSMMQELGLEPQYRKAPMIDAAIMELSATQRPLFVDEADYLLRQMDMLDAVRDIYDNAGVPVVLITMETAPRTIRTSPRLARFRRRITQWVEFAGLSLEDARKISKDLFEIHVEDDLLKRIHAETSGNIGEMVIALTTVDRFATANEMGTVSLATFGNRPLMPHGPRAATT